MNFITGITGLVVTGTSNDGTYTVRFFDGTFDDAYGTGIVTADLAFQSNIDASVVSVLIDAALNGATPHDRVASAESATTATNLFDDGYLLPYAADATTPASASAPSRSAKP